MIPTPNGFSKCRKCGAEQRLAVEVVKTERETNKDIIVLEEDKPNMPTMEKECEQCGNNVCYFWLIQTRASDEPPTRFFRCTTCRHTWREYS